MTSKVYNNEDDSFIILGTSPGTSLDLRCNGDVLDKAQIEDAMKDLPAEASLAFKAHFNLGDNPSPASMMVASTIVTDDRSTEELQKRFGELLDENIILKETLKQNNDSMKEQLQLIASCQDDMLNTHRIHKEKFDETRELVERLRRENKKLKHDALRSAEGVDARVGPDRPEARSGASSGVEFVTSPDDDTINKLTAQLELVEKQRRQVIVENEKLTWQKESLEHIVDATTKERDDIKEKLKNLELQLSTAVSEHAQEVKKLHFIIQELQSQLKTASSKQASSDDIAARDKIIQQLEGKISTLHNEVKMAQIKILDLENIKLEYTQHKSGVSETVRMYKEQIQDLSTRLRDAQTTVFQPMRISISSEPETSSSEFASYVSNVKLYDRTLKHLADFLNELTNGLSDSLAQTLGVVASLCDFKLERGSAERVREGLASVKLQLERQHGNTLNSVGKLRGMVQIFEGIFKEYNEVLKKSLTKTENQSSNGGGVEALTAALVARGNELQQLRAELLAANERHEDADVLRAQLQLYKSDFEAEREAREKMASEKDNLLSELRTTQKRNLELSAQLEEVRKLNPGLFRTVTAKKSPTAQSSGQPSATSAARNGARISSTVTTATGNMVYTCPKCMRFSSDQYKVMEDHFDFCLDDF